MPPVWIAGPWRSCGARPAGIGTGTQDRLQRLLLRKPVGHWDAFAPTTDSAMSFPFSPVPRQGRLTGRPSVRKTDG
jgi:hypothetical protein